MADTKSGDFATSLVQQSLRTHGYVEDYGKSSITPIESFISDIFWKPTFWLPKTAAIPNGFPLVVRYQEQQGTVDEKLINVTLNLVHYNSESGLIAFGGGIRPQIIEWLKSMHRKHPKFNLFLKPNDFGVFFRDNWPNRNGEKQ